MARFAEHSGVSRIFVDLERLGKYERQGHLNTFISQHSMSDVKQVKRVLCRAELLVRLNPLNPDTPHEIEQAISSGADILMQPMFRDVSEVAAFSAMINGRVKFIPLIETGAAFDQLEAIVRVKGVSEVYIGLNDLHLDLGLAFMFEPFSNGMLERAAEIINAAGKPFGVGGIARVGEGTLPGEMVLGEHLRLGSSQVILSRTFNRDIDEEGGELSFAAELGKLRDAQLGLLERSDLQKADDHRRVCNVINEFIRDKNEKAI